MTYRLFISHSWAYSDSYESLIDLLDRDPKFYFNDNSVPKHDPVHTSGSDRKLAEAIYSKMYNCNCILVLAGVYSTYSRWINTEIEIAKDDFKYPKPVIGIIPRGQLNLSTFVQDNADEIVYWNSKSIIRAIKKNSR